jgi:DNA-binding response OmpR family regulator
MPKHILIVDDDEDDRELFAAALTQIDQKILCSHAGNGEYALRFLLRSKDSLPDYIFLDLNMPRLSGKQCLVELKKDTALQSIPVIIYSTSKLQEDIEETKKLGAAYFITKPSNFRELCKEILFVLSHRWEEVVR